MMKKPIWNLESIQKRCTELGIEHLNTHYKHNIKSIFKCSCGNTFERLFSNVNKGQALCENCFKQRDKIRKAKFLEKRFFEFKKFVESESESGCLVLGDLESYKSNKSKILVQCSCGSSFSPTANNFYRGHQSCLNCARKESGIKKRITEEEIVSFVKSKKCKLINYEYTKEHRLLIECPKHLGDPYEISYANFYTGHRCPMCKASKGELRVRNFLSKQGFNFQEQFGFDDLKGFTGRVLKFDFAIKDSSENVIALIEFDGEQHFKPKFGIVEFERTLRNDALKNDYCSNKNIILQRIPYTQIDCVEEIINHMAIPR